RIHSLLAELDDPQVASYLRGEDSVRRRFQLADRLAGLYSQYLVYRRDWLLRWERDERSGFAVAGHWQGELWRRIVLDIGQGHRAQRMNDLLAALPRMSADPDQPALHVFGHSHLPRDILLALRQLARSRLVNIYFPDPCRELWEDLRQQRTHYLAGDEGPFLQLAQPLLASLGRLGQHHALLLNSLDAHDDDRDLRDREAREQPQDGLLQRLQNAIRTLQPTWSAQSDEALLADDSLRIHACHTRLRELEVLKDVLLDQLARHRDLQPRQIVVMAPNMAAYAPLIPAVFGQAGRSGGLLPYHLADVSLGRTHPLLTAFMQLLDLPGERISRSQVLALLGLPAVMRRLGLDESQLAAIERWLVRSQVAWGLDGPMKADFGAAPVADNSFAFGFDRMASGFLLGQVPPEQLLDGILPAAPVAGPDAQALGPLWALLELLADWRAQCAHPRRLSEWSWSLQDWIERLFQADWQDDEEQSALAALDRAVMALRVESEQAGCDPEVEWPVVQQALLQSLETVPERQAFLAGGMTFCGMVPQRAIPFEVVALLGLNDGEFPRSSADAGLDLLLRHPRVGDRASRSEDRYLFLEALMSARRALHLSWVGQGVQDGKPRNPALPLAELMRQLDRAHGLEGAAAKGERPWLLRHALQPFDARYFESDSTDPRWFSYSAEFAATQADPQRLPWAFLRDAPALPQVATAQTVALEDLCEFLARPAQWLCLNALGLSRSALEDEQHGDQEPLTRDRDPRDDTPVQLLWQALHDGLDQIPLDPPVHLRQSGQLAAGWVGDQAYAELREQAQALLDGLRALPPFAEGAPLPDPQAIDLTLDGIRLVGQVPDVYRAESARWLVRVVNSAQADFGKLLPLYAQWAALRLSRPDEDSAVALLQPDGERPPGSQRNDWVKAFPHSLESLQAGLLGLVQEYRQAEQTAGRYFPRSSHAAAKALASGKEPLAAARKTWRSPFVDAGEADYAPGYNQMLGGDETFLAPGTAGAADFIERARRYLRWLGMNAGSGSAS
ncbi:MAG: exodeoxyribonuclease V subunit gamma, partial [Xanthomonadales bacterium]|nr:exodeoxyribonuclease V subunit gamma [Xanthomonadales bacterium]